MIHPKLNIHLNNHSINALKLLDNGDLACASSDHTIIILNIHDGSVRRILVGHSDSVLSLLPLNSEILASGSMDKTIRIWNIHTGRTKIILYGHTSGVTALNILSNGELISGSLDSRIKTWNINEATLKRSYTIERYPNDINPITDLKVLLNGDFISSSNDSFIRIWRNGQIHRFLEHHKGAVLSLGLINENTLVSSSADENIIIWDLTCYNVKHILKINYARAKNLNVVNNGDVVTQVNHGILEIINPFTGYFKKHLEVARLHRPSPN